MRTDDQLWHYLKRFPAHEALLRAIEARFEPAADPDQPGLDLQDLAQTGPTLDLPDEAGNFAMVVGGSSLGQARHIDASVRPVAQLLQAPDSQLGTSGGLLILAAPSDHFGRRLFGSSALRRLGLDRAAAAYEGWFGGLVGQRRCDSITVWHGRLAAAELRVVSWQYALSTTALRRLELARFLSFPATISKLIFGRWIIAPWRSNLAWMDQWLRPAFEEPSPEQGAYLLIAARRIESGQEVGLLPAASRVEPSSQWQPAESAPAPSPETDEIGGAIATPPELELEPELPETVPAGSQVKSLIWLGLAFLFALLGQMGWDWHKRPDQPGAGLTWYGLALLALAIFIGIRAPQGRSRVASLGFTIRSPGPWLRENLWTWGPSALALFLSLFAWWRLQDEIQPQNSPLLALVIWGSAIGLATIALWPGALARLGRRFGVPVARNDAPVRQGVLAQLRAASWRPWEIGALAALGLLAFLVRFIRLGDIPYILAGDEANMGIEAARILAGELQNPFVTGWFSHPTLFFYILALPIRLFGQTAFAVRFFSPLIGAVTVLALYLFARRAWGRVVAFAAAVLLAGYHFHIHYSRLGLNNIWDGLFALVVMGLFWRAWVSKDRRCYVLGGLVLGVSQYFYMGSRMLLIMLAILLGYWLVVNPRELKEQLGDLASALVVALVVALPIVLFSVLHPNEYMARVNQLGIFQSGWLGREVVITGRSEISLLWQQLWKSALAFNYTVDPTFWYRPEIPLLQFLPSILFIFGLGLALAGVKRTPNFVLLSWVGATVFFAGVLLENPPSSQRYVIAAPAVCILVALALVWIVKRLRLVLGGRRLYWRIGIALVTLWIVAGDLDFYFNDYTPHRDFGGINTEVANRVAEYVADLGTDDWQVYFFGPPRMGISAQGGFPSTPYLIPDAKSMDIWDPLTTMDGFPAVRPPAVFIFLPERLNELEVVKSMYPVGAEKHFPGRDNRMLFIAYEVLGQ